MRPTEIKRFAENALNHVVIDADLIQQYAYGQEWKDSPFPNAQKLRFETTGYFTRSASIGPVGSETCSFGPKESDQFRFNIFETDLKPNSNWIELLFQIDWFLFLIGDRHHIYLTTIASEGDVLQLYCDS